MKKYGIVSKDGMLISITDTTEDIAGLDTEGRRVILIDREIPKKQYSFQVFSVESWSWIDIRTPETEWPLVRVERDKLLQQSDWTQLPDVPIATKEAWATYRQALRDITEQPDPFNIVWPVPPQ